MRSGKFAIIAAIVIVGMLAGCKSGVSTPTTPTMSSEDVIHTAEAIVEETRQAVTNTPTMTPVPPSPTTPPETPTSTATATPSKPKVTANYNANVRYGPDESYPVIDFMLEGQEGEPLGRYIHSTLGTWWYIERIGQGLNGWVWGGAVTFSGDANSVPYWDAPPTPTASPAPTEEPTEEPTATITPTP
jgi:hypothetical protein